MMSNENLALAKKWSKRWEDEQTYATVPNDAPKYFVTFPFPYVNGAPHVGHAFSCFRADVFARFKRLQGFNVLFLRGSMRRASRSSVRRSA
jgi:leucyl-tRNA synthetase